MIGQRAERTHAGHDPRFIRFARGGAAPDDLHHPVGRAANEGRDERHELAAFAFRLQPSDPGLEPPERLACAVRVQHAPAAHEVARVARRRLRARFHEAQVHHRPLVGRPGRDAGAGILVLPARGKSHRERHLRMEVAIALEVALPRIVPEDQPVEALNVAAARDHERGLAPRRRRSQPSRALLAIARIGMGGEESGQPLAGALADALEHPIGGGHLARVVAGLRAVLHAQLVGLGLVVAAVLEHQQPKRALRRKLHTPGHSRTHGPARPVVRRLPARDLG